LAWTRELLLDQHQVLDDRPERERREEGEAADDEDHAD
jgi:hypothetical protein